MINSSQESFNAECPAEFDAVEGLFGDGLERFSQWVERAGRAVIIPSRHTKRSAGTAKSQPLLTRHSSETGRI
jgi:hypothetical protein